MAADLSKIAPELKAKVEQLLENCRRRGIDMRPSTGLRTPREQAVLWRQSRSIEEITRKIAELHAAGANHLAKVLKDAGAQSGRDVTGAIPGLSWHQWGEAVDCFWLVDGKAEWSTTRKINGLNGYHLYADEAEKLGLTAGGHWPRRKDWPHVQLRAEDNPGKLFSLTEIDATMRQRFP